MGVDSCPLEDTPKRRAVLVPVFVEPRKGIPSKCSLQRGMVMNYTAGSLAKAIQARMEGDPALEVAGVAAPERAGARDLIYVESAKHVERALASPALCG